MQEMYSPPRFSHGVGSGTQKRSRLRPARLWLVNLRDGELPDKELNDYEKGETRARRFLKDAHKTELEFFHWPHKPRMADELQRGDSVIQIIRFNTGQVRVFPPARFLHLHTYPRAPHRERYVFYIEIPKGGQR